MKGFVGGSSRDILVVKILFSLIYQVTRRIHVYALGFLELVFCLKTYLSLKAFMSISSFCPFY